MNGEDRLGEVDADVLGHESIETTQIYLDANLELKERMLAKTAPPDGKTGRYRPDDRLLAFLSAL